MKQRQLPSEDTRKNVSDEKNAEYTATLKKMVDCKTVWTKDGQNAAEFQRLYEVIAQAFPLLHSKAKRLTFGDGCFFYVIEGQSSQKNILLMSHHDVVDGGDGWDTDPFCAEVKDGALYGRGTVDTKAPLFAELQAAEELLAEGYDFSGITLYIGSSHNEEFSGDGMVLAAEYFRRKGIRFEVILDEGGAITSGMIPGVSAKSAMVAVHEKSRHVYRCSVKENTQGHGGLNPTTGSPVATLCAFVTKVSRSKICKASFSPEVKATFLRHAPYMAFPLNLIFGAFPLFSPLIKKIMAGIPQAAAMLSTGLTFPSFFGGNEENPQFKAKEASVYLYLRCVREEQLHRELAKIQKIADHFGVEIQQELRDYCEPSSFDSQPYRVLEELLHQNFPDVIVAPYLLTAGTDARRFTGLSDCILRFTPIDLNKAQFASIHNCNENITIRNIGQCVLFYKDFIQKF